MMGISITDSTNGFWNSYLKMAESLPPLSQADYVVVISFFVVMLTIGFYYSGRMHNLKDFFSGNKCVPWWLSGASFYMSTFSAFTFVAYSALAYQYGFVSVTLFWLTVPASLVAASVFAARWRRSSTTSPLEYIEERFGKSLRQFLAWLGIPVRIIDDGLKLFAIGTLVSVSLNVSLMTSIVVCGVILLSYTMLGGLWAVLVTDFVQFVIMVAVVIVLLPLVSAEVGGISGFIENAPPGFFSWTSNQYTVGYFIAFSVILILNYSTSWALVQRFYSVGSDKDARRVGYLVAFLNVIGPPILFAPAMAARLFLPEVNDPNTVYALLCRHILPAGMVGMLISAMFSATMSMISSDYNAMASVLTNDIYKRLISPQASDRALIVVARITTVLVGLISLVVAIVVMLSPGEGDLFQKMVRVFAIFIPPIALPMLAGLTLKKISNAGAFAGLLSGMLVGLIAFFMGTFYPDYTMLLKEQYIVTLTGSVTTLGMIIGSYLRPETEAERECANRFFNKLDAEGDTEQEAIPAAQFTSPLSVIGVSVVTLGLLLVVATQYYGVDQSTISLKVGISMIVLGGGMWMGSIVAAKEKENGE